MGSGSRAQEDMIEKQNVGCVWVKDDRYLKGFQIKCQSIIPSSKIITQQILTTDITLLEIFNTILLTFNYSQLFCKYIWRTSRHYLLCTVANYSQVLSMDVLFNSLDAMFQSGTILVVCTLTNPLSKSLKLNIIYII